MTADSRRLLERYCRRGDQASFNTFYRSQADRLWRYLCARGSSRDSAYDLLAEAFLRFLQVICRDPRHPVALLYRIADNLRIDAWRRERTALSRSPGAGDADTTAEDPAGERGYVRALVKTLPEDEQKLLLLRYWIGLTHKEIAGVVGRPEGTVRRQCASALKALKQRWQEDDHD